MKYFEVVQRITTYSGETCVEHRVFSDGTLDETEIHYQLSPDETGEPEYIVYVMDEDGQEVDQRSYDNLDDIKRDFPPTDWQNNDW